jgi:adenylylsulfate kinase-like enzyme
LNKARPWEENSSLGLVKEVSRMKKGRLIVLEGMSGVGKTTLARNWVKTLTDREVPVIYLHGALSRGYI